MSIPNKLREYLEKHLHILLTLRGASGDENAEWGIFFSTRPAMPLGDPNFNGSIDGVANLRPVWELDKSIWIVPLNRAANEISRRARKQHIDNRTHCGAIAVSRAYVENPVGGDNWKKYSFPSDGKGQKFNLDSASTVKPNCDLGAWQGFRCDGDNGEIDEWFIWHTKSGFGSYTRAVEIQAPKNHVAKPDGTYAEFGLFIGVRRKNSPNLGPYLGIDIVGDKPPLSATDAPIIWTENKRIDDVVVPHGAADSFEVANFGRRPLDREASEDWKRTTEVLTCVNDDDDENKLKGELFPWLIKEKDGQKSEISVIYARSYTSAQGRLPFEASVRILQINRGRSAHLFVKHSVAETIYQDGKKLFAKVRDGVQSTQAANPMGIVPEICGRDETFGAWVGEWTSPYGSGRCSQDSYSLSRSMLRGHTDSLFKVDNIKLRLLRSTKSFIQLNSVTLETDVQIASVNDNATALRLLLQDYQIDGKAPLTMVDGAFEFEFETDKLASELTGALPPKELGEIRFTLQNTRSQTPFFFWNYHSGLSKEDVVLQFAIEDFALPARRVRAAGQDLLRTERLLAAGTTGAVVEGQGERNDPPLLVPIDDSRAGENSGAKYLLIFSESVNVGQDYRHDARLQAVREKSGVDQTSTLRAVVIDTNPQFVGLLESRYLQQPGYDDGAWVLARRSPLSLEDGAWEILDDSATSEGFKLILPSQAVGEAYVKKNHPQHADGTGDATLLPDDGEPREGKPIDFRFGAPAMLRLSNERLDRRYVSPPWNLRHIWGQPGNVLPGVPFHEAQFEFLYGLTGYMKPDETFVAELAAKLGELPVPPDNSIFWTATGEQSQAFARAWKNYLRFYRAWKSRLAVLELSRDDAFSNARFKDGVDYSPRIAFRSKLARAFSPAEVEVLIEDLERLDSNPDIVRILEEAKNLQKEPTREKDELLRKSLAEGSLTGIYRKAGFLERIGASLRYPIADGSEIPANSGFDPEDLDDLAKKIRYSHDPDGLAGGFHYGFESGAIYNEFWREAYREGSSSGELDAPAFSSLGGWGKQTARFAGDKTIIKSITSMGRTNFYAVERIGRIGVLWHKAKHVIEYERTTVRSKYFEHQLPLVGRPLVRKVREYVEILEPDRSYPDFPGHGDDSPGSVKACCFKSRVIPVQSSWGRDVSFRANGAAEPESYGWEVKLWDEHADPKLFPKPQVVFDLIPPADSNVESVAVNLSEPQNLYFYTDTRDTVDLSASEKGVMLTADTSKWPAIKYVDYTDLKPPDERHLKPASDANSGQGMERELPTILDVPPGFERYTFRVDESELPSGVANRYNPNSGISGKLKAVTLVRTPFDEQKPPSTTVPGVEAFKALVESPNSLINQIYNGELSDCESVDSFADKVADIFDKRGIPGLLSPLQTPEPVLVHFNTLHTDGKGKLDTFPAKFLWGEAVRSAEGVLNRTLATYRDKWKVFESEITELKKRGGAEVAEARAALTKFKDRLGLTELNIEYGRDFIAEAEIRAQTSLKTLLEPADRFRQQIGERLMEVEELLGNLGNDLEAGRSKAIELLDRIKGEGESIALRINELKIPGNTKKGLADAVQKILDLEKTVRAGVEASTEIDEIIAALQSFVDELRVNKLLEAYDKAVVAINDTIQGISSGFEQFADTVEGLVKEFNQSIDDAIRKSFNEIEKAWDAGSEKLKFALKKVEKCLECRILIGDSTCTLDDGSDACVDIFRSDEKPPAVKTLLANVLGDPVSNAEPSVFWILEKLDSLLNYALESSELTAFIERAKKFANSRDVEEWLKTLDACRELEDAIAGGNPAEIARKSAALAESINKEFGKLAGEVAEKIKLADQAAANFDLMVNSGKQVLDNYRSVWSEFTAPGMGLNRKTVAMIVNKDWDDVQQRLSITPCIARVKQFENDLEALGLRLPVTNVFEGLLPPKPDWANTGAEYAESLLNRFNFSDVLSDIGAMRLDKMFPNFKMPNDLRDNIKVTQGFDKQNLTAWVNADADFKLGAPRSLLKIGPLELFLSRGKFVAKARVEMDIDGNSKKQKSGLLSGDWETRIANQPVMIFKDAKVIFEDDRLTFDLDPSRMEMPGLMKILTDASKKIAPVASGPAAGGEEKPDVFKLNLLEIEGDKLNPVLAGRKVPIGVTATLDIPPLSVGGGTTSMTNLSLGGHFLLKFWDEELDKFGFMTGLGFYLGKQDAPFNFTAFILGGGGFVDCAITFRPEQGLAVRFVLSVHASAGFAITAGWIKGSVLIMLGFEGEYIKPANGQGRAGVTIFIQIIGEVDILGLVSVYILLRLEAKYDSHKLIGSGTVKLRIKICWCVTVRVNKKYTKTLAGKEDSPPTQQSSSSISGSLG